MSKYLRCDGCGEILDRLPVGITPRYARKDGLFYDADTIRLYATSIGWKHIAGPFSWDGHDYCPKCEVPKDTT